MLTVGRFKRILDGFHEDAELDIFANINNGKATNFAVTFKVARIESHFRTSEDGMLSTTMVCIELEEE